MASTFDLNTGHRRTAASSAGSDCRRHRSWQSLLADPLARFALRALAGDTVDRMADLLAEENELVTVLARTIGEFSAHGWAPSFAMPADVYRQAILGDVAGGGLGVSA